MSRERDSSMCKCNSEDFLELSVIRTVHRMPSHQSADKKKEEEVQKCQCARRNN